MSNLMASHLQAHVMAACAHVKHGDTWLRDGSGHGCIRHTYVSHGVHVGGGCQCVMLSLCMRNQSERGFCVSRQGMLSAGAFLNWLSLKCLVIKAWTTSVVLSGLSYSCRCVNTEMLCCEQQAAGRSVAWWPEGHMEIRSKQGRFLGLRTLGAQPKE